MRRTFLAGLAAGISLFGLQSSPWMNSPRRGPPPPRSPAPARETGPGKPRRFGGYRGFGRSGGLIDTPSRRAFNDAYARNPLNFLEGVYSHAYMRGELTLKQAHDVLAYRRSIGAPVSPRYLGR